MFIKVCRTRQSVSKKHNDAEVHRSINVLLCVLKFLKVNFLFLSKNFLNLFSDLFLDYDSCIEVLIASSLWCDSSFLCPYLRIIDVLNRDIAENYSWILRSYIPVSIEVKDVKNKSHLSFNWRVIDFEHYIDKLSQINIAVLIYIQNAEKSFG